MRASAFGHCLAFLVLLGGGCASRDAARDGLRSRYPLDRAIAAVRSAEAGDASAVHRLVELLEDSDRAVRMYSINALVRLTGKDYGYRHYESDAARTAAVGRWRDALRRGEVAASVGQAAADGPALQAGSAAGPTQSE